MRLDKVRRGHRLPQRLMLNLMRVVTRAPVPDYMRMLIYRPELYGKRYLALAQSVMRGPSDWSVGERELFAAFVARLNRCAFCIPAHVSTASRGLGAQIVEAALDESQTSSRVDAKVRAALSFVKKLTLAPGDVVPDDVVPLRAAGLSDAAIEDAVRVTVLFNVTNRMADALGVDVPEPEYFARLAGMGMKRGYGFRIPRVRLA